MEPEMTAKAKKGGVERRITSGNIWAIITVVAGVIGGTGYQHYIPSIAAQDASTAAHHASEASEVAVQKAADAAAKAATIESTVAAHSSEINLIATSVDQLKLDVAVLKSQGDAAKASAQSESEKLDRLLAAVYRMQGASGTSRAAGSAAN
jgi:hypothetical protein